MATGGGAWVTCTVKACCTANWLASFACRVKVKLPAAVGVPLSTPVAASSARPVGKVPLLSVYTYGATPPPAVKAWL
ncbi:hypothetical protein D3C81_2020260 [compost metagenome]